jgi:ketosteroid isomerase-like protein
VTVADQNIEALRRWNAIYSDEGFDAAMQFIDEIFDPEIEYSPLLGREVESRVCHGCDEVRTFFGELNDTLGGMHFSVSGYDPVTDTVIVLHSKIVGTGRGSTVPIAQDLELVCEFEDGLVRRMTTYASLEDAMEAARVASDA